MLARLVGEKPVATIIGTRPEAIKIAPVLRALARRDIGCALVCTGQHPALDLEGANVGRAADAVLALEFGELDADAMCARIEEQARAWIERERPRLVLVQGDTNSALAGARAASRCGIPIGHVEAGLRTYDIRDPWPEERNRVAIDAVADLLFAPTRQACDNLLAERVPGRIVLTGNTGIDAMIDARDTLPPTSVAGPTMILVTMHRRENRGGGVRRLALALREIAARSDACFAVVLHPNAAARAEMSTVMADVPRATLLEPQSYRGTIALMQACRLILTDSGGLQEEAPALGRPLLVLRDATERPEAIACGNAMLVGTDPARIASEALRLLGDAAAHAAMSVPHWPFGTGGAAALIACEIEAYLRDQGGRISQPPNPLPLAPAAA